MCSVTFYIMTTNFIDVLDFDHSLVSLGCQEGTRFIDFSANRYLTFPKTDTLLKQQLPRVM